MKMSTLYFEVHGDASQIGKAIGEHTRKQISRVWELYEELYNCETGKHFRELADRTSRFACMASSHHPSIYAELKGIAKGSNRRLEDIFLLTCLDEMDWHGDYPVHCTTIAMRTGQGVVLGHNEEWSWRYKDGLYLVKAQPADGVAFLSLAYAGTPPGSIAGMNEHGLCFAADSLDTTSTRKGVPKNILLRHALSCQNRQEVLRLVSQYARAAGNTIVAADESGAEAIEMTPDLEAVVAMKKGLVYHTNHAVTQVVQQQAKPAEQWSIDRYRRLARILRPTMHSLKTALQDHAGEYPICLHRKHDEEETTVASVLAHPSHRELHVCHGNPCEGAYQMYSL